jgi:carbonic anhydrase
MHPHQSTQARGAVAGHQEPWALIHGCVDSRVSPELVFDQGIGDVFSARTAGAVLDDTIVGSMEFAASAPYAVPLIVILGHTGCGAVTATVEALAKAPRDPQAPGEVADILREIAPVAGQVRRLGDQAAYVDEVVRANAVAVSKALLARSKIIRAAVAEGRTRVVPAVYDLGSGRVEWSVA